MPGSDYGMSNIWNILDGFQGPVKGGRGILWFLSLPPPPSLSSLSVSPSADGQPEPTRGSRAKP